MARKRIGGEKKRGEPLEMLAVRFPVRLKWRLRRIRGYRQTTQTSNISLTDMIHDPGGDFAMVRRAGEAVQAAAGVTGVSGAGEVDRVQVYLRIPKRVLRRLVRPDETCAGAVVRAAREALRRRVLPEDAERGEIHCLLISLPAWLVRRIDACRLAQEVATGRHVSRNEWLRRACAAAA